MVLYTFRSIFVLQVSHESWLTSLLRSDLEVCIVNYVLRIRSQTRKVKSSAATFAVW